VRLYVLTRHAQSTLNHENRINGDPSLPFGLTEDGRAQARALGLQVAHLPLERCVVTRFPRTHETADLALGERAPAVPRVVEPLLDDIDVGEFDGRSLVEYRAFKRGRSRNEPFPGGESLNAAAERYADAFERLLARGESVTLVVAHEIPVRYAVNAAAGSADLDGPIHDIANATPYVFDEPGLARAVARIRELAGRVRPAA
jgi:broad specificity phosphatase PhoE